MKKRIVSNFTSPLNTKRLRKHSLPSQKYKKESRLDIWLLRISYFSQVGLFALTILGFYFTVIPLYQKAVLDEAIAMKEIELKSMQKTLEKSYSQIRTFSLHQFIFNWGAECTGLLIRIPRSSIDRKEILKETEPRSKILELDSSTCLREAVLKDKNLKNLNKEDYEKLREQVDKLAADLDGKRKVALQDFKDFPNKAKTDPSVLEPVEGFALSILEPLRRYMSSQQQEAWLFSAAVHQGQMKIESKYAVNARASIQKLSEIYSNLK
ncbi:hypothetical protein [Herbaspirillum lusitanum]|uniref:hypothetical protein n=1 Tax=Herbaspirillum lusitanum TaxID=213312 RepID=UPI0012F48D31|nr:hypothetical protein [Herbaspirillum lusitanum]